MRFISRYFKGFIMSLGMFSAIPLPFNPWDGDCVNLVLPCFPLVGLVIGALWLGAAKLLIFFELHTALTAALLACTPFVLSGFIHLDGYMDTSDAVLSSRPLEDRLRILKDPHMGAFSAVMLALLFILQFAAMYAAVDRGAGAAPLIVIPVLSRCCSAAAVLILKPISQSGYAHTFKQNTRISHKVFIMVCASVSIILTGLCAGTNAMAVAFTVIFAFACCMAYLYRLFNGISGDLTGFAIAACELCGVIAMGALGA